jgi:hypothetical protein
VTATHVNGLSVIADEPTPSPLTDKAGNQVMWPRVRRLLLADGSTTYGCAECEFTAPTSAKVRGHLQGHREKPKRTPSLSGLSLDDLLAKVDKLEKVTADRDAWKRRALAAERGLETIRKAFRG